MAQPKPRGIKKLLKIARANVSREISAFSETGDKYARGLASEGYAGGYQAALDDVLLALNGVIPQRHGWWESRGSVRSSPEAESSEANQ